MKKKILYITIAFLVVFVLLDCNVANASNQAPDVYLTLVNKTHPVPDDWESMVDINTVFNSLGEELKIEHKTYDQFLYLRDELLNEGIQIELDSVYRSVAEQQEIWDEWMVEYGEEYVRNYLVSWVFRTSHWSRCRHFRHRFG
ncbi:D-alanyl-D-alanine carboxypeptidase family protein [Candidatus Saccharibacteria bacterium]|nr:D-alanyl-D-alanine carboxypeptidase family protein [Candidatus Saccharibacteria bacterium]